MDGHAQPSTFTPGPLTFPLGPAAPTVCVDLREGGRSREGQGGCGGWAPAKALTSPHLPSVGLSVWPDGSTPAGHGKQGAVPRVGVLLQESSTLQPASQSPEEP